MVARIFRKENGGSEYENPLQWRVQDLAEGGGGGGLRPGWGVAAGMGGCGRDGGLRPGWGVAAGMGYGVGVDDIMLLSQVSHFENHCVSGAVHQGVVKYRYLTTPCRACSLVLCSGYMYNQHQLEHVPCNRFWTIVSGRVRAPSPVFYFSKPRSKPLRAPPLPPPPPSAHPLNPPLHCRDCGVCHIPMHTEHRISKIAVLPSKYM